jgi:hypothetical protein
MCWRSFTKKKLLILKTTLDKYDGKYIVVWLSKCRNPSLAKCGGEAQHLERLGFGVLRDSRMFRARQQGEKHLALGCSWCRRNGLET